jgi:hypothetical protein
MTRGQLESQTSSQISATCSTTSQLRRLIRLIRTTTTQRAGPLCGSVPLTDSTSSTVRLIRGSHPREAARKSRRKPSYSSESREEGERTFVRCLGAMLNHSQGLARRLLSPARGSKDLSPTRGRATLGGMARSHSARPTAPGWACRAAGSV